MVFALLLLPMRGQGSERRRVAGVLYPNYRQSHPAIKSGHCRNQIRPLRVETGQYPIANRNGPRNENVPRTRRERCGVLVDEFRTIGITNAGSRPLGDASPVRLSWPVYRENEKRPRQQILWLARSLLLQSSRMSPFRRPVSAAKSSVPDSSIGDWF